MHRSGQPARLLRRGSTRCSSDSLLAQSGMGTCGDEIGYGLTGATTDHQGFADEHGASAGLGIFEHVMWPANAGLSDLDYPRGDAGSQSRERAAVDLEGLEVPGIDADDPGAGLDGPVGLGLVMNLNQSRHP